MQSIYKPVLKSDNAGGNGVVGEEWKINDAVLYLWEKSDNFIHQAWNENNSNPYLKSQLLGATLNFQLNGDIILGILYNLCWRPMWIRNLVMFLVFFFCLAPYLFTVLQFNQNAIIILCCYSLRKTASGFDKHFQGTIQKLKCKQKKTYFKYLT